MRPPTSRAARPQSGRPQARPPRREKPSAEARRASRAAWSVSRMRDRCREAREALHVRKLASPEELDAYWPGGAENGEECALGGFIYCYANYTRMLGRSEQRGPGGALRDPLAPNPQADARVLDALRAEPVAVRLVGQAEQDPPLYVYPKSLDALLHVHALDAQLAWMTDQHARLVAMRTPDALDALPAVMEALAYTYQLLAWIVTTPGPAMPYAADDDRPEPPAHIRALEPWDVVRICEAHQKHLLRTHAVAQLVDERRQRDGEDGKRASWSMFIGSLAMDGDGDTVTLMKHRSLHALLAASRLSNAAKAPPKKGDAAVDATPRPSV